MPTAQKMINRKDIIKHTQYAVEGHTPANYAGTINNGRFVCPGSNSSITKENSPSFINNEFGGTYDRQGIHKVRDTNTLTYKSRLHESTLSLLSWATNLPDGAGTPAESRTFLDSYRDTGGNEVYRVWKGCKPTSITVSVSKEDALMVEIQMSCKDYYETQTLADAKVTGNSVWDNEVMTAPLRFKDVGQFQYNTDGRPAGGTELSYRAFSVTTTWGLLTQDSNASETDVFIDHGTRRITGSMEIFKNNQILNEQARQGTQNVSYMELIDSETADVQASKQLGNGGNTIKISSKLPGAIGNGISLTVPPRVAANTKTKISVINRDITITLKGAGSPLQEIKTAIDAHPLASKLVSATVAGVGTTVFNTPTPKTPLTGGTDGSKKIILERFRFMPSDENLLEQSEATIESKSFEADSIHVVT